MEFPAPNCKPTHPAPPEGSRRSHSVIRLAAALLVLATLVLYWPAMHYDFLNYDDNVYVSDNPHVTSGLTWANFEWAFTNPVSANWHPLTMFSHMLDCQIYGLKPWGHHLTSVLFHALNAALVFLLLRRLTGAVWRSLMVAALFAVHPLRVESVAWVAERKDVLSGCFGLLTLFFYTLYVQNSKLETRNSKLFYALALLLFACGLMSKPILVTWPCVMLLLDYWPLRRISDFRFPISDLGTAKGEDKSKVPLSRLVWEKAPFFGVAAVAGVVTFFVQQHNGAMEMSEILPLGARAGNALISYCRYLGKLLWPADMSVFYPHPGYWPWGQVVLAGSLLAGISVLVWTQRRRYPFMLMGWLWFLGTLVPVIGLVQVGQQSMADRYTYLPTIGLFIMGIWGGYELIRSRGTLAVGLGLAATAAIILCLVLTRQQLAYWRDSESLFRHASIVTRNNYIAFNNLALALNRKGRTDEAIAQFQEAIRAKPDFAEAQNNLGFALYLQGRINDATPWYQNALRLKPEYAEAHCNLGIALHATGQADEAMLEFQEALRLKPDYSDAHYNLALALVQKGRNDEAIPQFQEVLHLKPDDAQAHYNLGIVLNQQGRTNEAIAQYQEALRLKPDNAGACNNLGLLWAARGQNLDQARALIQKAVALEPRNAAMLDSLAWVLLKQNQPREALKYQQQAIDNCNPPNAVLYDHLGDIYAALRQVDLAAGAWRKSLSLAPDPQIEEKLGGLSHF